MIIDFHTHIFPRAIRDRRETYFQSESAFKHLYSSPAAKLAGVKEILHAMDEHGVDKSVVFGFPWKKSKTFKQHNDYILEAVTRHPRRFIGFCCVDPFHPDAVTEAVRCLEQGLSGIGELAFYQTGIDAAALDKLAPLMEICRHKKLPVLIHTNEPIGHIYPGKSPLTLRQTYNLVKKFPENIIVLAHWGGGIFFFNLLKKEVKETLENVYVDTAASPFLYDPLIYTVGIQAIGPHKILFGSDFPLLNPARYFKEMQQAGVTKHHMDAVCGRNAERLLKQPDD